tara:strand:+ start:734 stop:1021 length:288 start_codon:yes stop_codon:yes gene_type:complete
LAKPTEDNGTVKVSDVILYVSDPSRPLLSPLNSIMEGVHYNLTAYTMSPHYGIISTSLNGKAEDPIGLQFLGSNPEVDGLIALSNFLSFLRHLKI